MKEQNDILEANILKSIELKKSILANSSLLATINEVAHLLVSCFQKGNKVLFCGNGGSAADAQHLSAELSGRYYYDRPPLPSEALHVNTSYLTAVANDYGYDYVYARMVEAIGQQGDMLICLSTSGNSENILKAIEAAHQKGMTVVGLSGSTGGKMAGSCDKIICIPSTDTPRIQECHILIGHTWCQFIEQQLFPK